MKKVGLIKALYITHKANKMTKEERMCLQQRRFKELVSYAKKNSPYYQKLYENIGEEFNITDLPVTNKVELMNNFDQWMTDRDMTLEKVKKFMENIDNVGRKMDGKYLVYTTSGSTGNPSIVLYDDTCMNVSSAIGVLRTYARKEDMKSFVKSGGKSIGIFADNGFYLGCGSIRYNLHKMPWKKSKLMTYDVRSSQEDIVAKLNSFKPSMLGSYPTALELLIDEKKTGRLNISPVIIMTGGEYLSDNVRRELSEVFGCYVQTNYSCTEGGTMACECTKQHFHINDDWTIIEAVDENNNPVPFGTQSTKILLTNLMNFVQPIIRFEITDRVIIHDEPCGCGDDRLWLELEGRTDEILTFNEGKKVAPLSLYALLKEVNEISRFQLVQKEECLLELRIIAKEKIMAFEKGKKVLDDYLRKNGIHAEIILSNIEPQTHPESGKFKHIICEVKHKSSVNIV